MYVFGFLVVWSLLVWRIRRGETKFSLDQVWVVAVVVFLGGIFGGRIGSIFLYGDGMYIFSWESFFSPIDTMTGVWIGWRGMSFFGALIGAGMFGWIVTYWKRISFFEMADFIVPAVPLGLFFGRIGNFLNGELWGRESGNFLAMRVEGVMRHPSQLYEAFFEGLVLFLFLWILRKKKMFPGALLFLFGIGYGVTRFVMEFFRDEIIYVWGMTQGQVYAGVLFLVSGMMFWWEWKKCDRIRVRDEG